MLACSHKRTVACQTGRNERVVLCHEWRDASDELVREVRGPICHAGDETFVDGPCPVDSVVGVCTHGTERTIFYRNPAFPYDGHKTCADQGDVWAPNL